MRSIQSVTKKLFVLMGVAVFALMLGSSTTAEARDYSWIKDVPEADGGGYWIFACQAAIAKYGLANLPNGSMNAFKAEYTSQARGWMVHILKFGGNKELLTQEFGEIWPINTDGGRAQNSHIKAQQRWQFSNTCDSSSNGSFGSKRAKLTENVYLPWDGKGNSNYEAGGETGVNWRLWVPAGHGLVVNKIYLSDDLKGFRPKQDTTGPVGVGRQGWFAHGGSTRGFRDFRVCKGNGTWHDARLTTKLGFNGIYWRDGSDVQETIAYKGPGVGSNNGHHIVNYFQEVDGTVNGTRYRMKTGPLSTSNPNSTCEISGEALFEFDVNEKRDAIFFHNSCYSNWDNKSKGRNIPTFDEPVGTAKQLCRSRNDEGSNNKNLMSTHWNAYAEAAMVYIADDKNPTLQVTPKVVSKSSETQQVTFTINNLYDAAGIRSLEFKVGDTLIAKRDGRCDYTFTIPCPGANGHAQPPEVRNGPPSLLEGPVNVWSYPNNTKLNASPFVYDFPKEGLYEFKVIATDGSGRTTTFEHSIGTLEDKDPCADNIILIETGSPCFTQNIDQIVTKAPDGTIVGFTPETAEAAPHAENKQAIFRYDLAFNKYPTRKPLDTKDCKIEPGISMGNGANGELTEREMNQIVSITIDLKGYVDRGKVTGQQDTTATLDLPARRSARYRNAIGCPG